jgi:hypothetical protein
VGRIETVKAVTVRAQDGTPLHVGVTGDGPDVLVLSGGPDCVIRLGSPGSGSGGGRCRRSRASQGSDLVRGLFVAQSHRRRVRHRVGACGARGTEGVIRRVDSRARVVSATCRYGRVDDLRGRR